MSPHWLARCGLASGLIGLSCLIALAPAKTKAPPTGPRTEKRFPALQTPKGFRATLFACDPLIEYTSAIALGPSRGSLFVAIDYMTGLGKEIVRLDEIRLVRDTDGDGYADKAIVYAKGFNSIQGMTFHDGVVYVMHAPFLTSLRDTNGDGVADVRRDLIKGLGLTPKENPVRLHCANGLVMGHDGWLYLALGDHGCKVDRPEGDRLVFNGGGILRCRPDGADLHVFATGLRNIYDVALDADGNVFVRDNENDGGDYMIRVCRSFFGADHGYPYLYRERPDEGLAPLADLGRGSSAGGLCYLETAFPKDYRGNLIFCEWGRAVVRYPLKRQGSGFGPVKELDFVSGAANDPYGFKPTDLVTDRDGALYVADWCDGQRPKRGRGRIYRISHASQEPAKNLAKPVTIVECIKQLDAPGYLARIEAQAQLQRLGGKPLKSLREALQRGKLGERGRAHATWVLALGEGERATPLLMELAKSDTSTAVRIQAVRALADLRDPVIAKHRLTATPDSSKRAKRLASLAKGQGAPVTLEIVIALGRLQWSDGPDWLRTNVTRPDAHLQHAAMQLMRRSRDWLTVWDIARAKENGPFRVVALRVLADQFEPAVVDAVITHLATEDDPARRKECADLLSRVHKKPGAWTYWGYRPPPRPAGTVRWSRTDAIAKALNALLMVDDFDVREFVLGRMRREVIPTRLDALSRWLQRDHDGKRVGAVLAALAEHPKQAVRAPLMRFIRDAKHTAENRSTALTLLVASAEKAQHAELMKMVTALEDGAVLAAALQHVAEWPDVKPGEFVTGKLASRSPVVRAAAVDALADLRHASAGPEIQSLLQDEDVQVRRAAAAALGTLRIKSAADGLLQLAKTKNADVRAACLRSLNQLGDGRAVAVATASLRDRPSRLAALAYLHKHGGPMQAKPLLDLAAGDVSMEVLPAIVQALSSWSVRHEAERAELERAIARVQGMSGIVLRWRVRGPVTEEVVKSMRKATEHRSGDVDWRIVHAAGKDALLNLPRDKSKRGDEPWLATGSIHLDNPQNLQVLTSGDGAMRVWLDGKLAYQRKEATPYQPDSDRFTLKLDKGRHRWLVALKPRANAARLHLRFRRISTKVEHEKLMQLALTRRGNPLRGRDVFLDVKRAQCLKCHRLEEQGERIGPELTGIGRRFSRVHLIESILQPSRSIGPGYQPVTVQLKKGQVVTGVRTQETSEVLTIADKEGKTHALKKSTIESMRAESLSIMPEGLERQITEQEFLDLIAFLESRK